MSTKSRLTITLPQDVLRQVDSLIDGSVVRNRSHAIETLVRESLSKTVTKAVILAGGRKPTLLHKIKGRLLLSIVIDQLKQAGIRRVLIAAGLHENEIRNSFDDGSDHGIELFYIKEPKLLGTAGVLYKVRNQLQTEPFLVMNGDVLTNLDLSEFIAFHRHEETVATIAVKPRMSERKYGQVFLQGNKITQFLEKGAQSGISIVNTGVYVFKPSVFDFMTKVLNLKSRLDQGKSASKSQPTLSIENNIFPLLAQKGELSAFLFQGLWYDISEKQKYELAQKNWSL